MQENLKMSFLSGEFSVTPKNTCNGEAGLERKNTNRDW